jgi:hypothetical protein
MQGLDLDSNRWESMLEREGERMILFIAGRKKRTIGREGGINTLRCGTTTTIFENLEPPGNFPKPSRSASLNRLSRYNLEPPGKNSKLPGTVRKTGKDNRVLRLFVAGIDFVLDKI